MYNTINVDYAENLGWKFSLKGMEIGGKHSDYIFFEDFSAIRRNEKDAIRYTETLGILTFLEEIGKQSITGEEQRKLVIAERVDKMYENLFEKSFYRGITAIPLAVKKYKESGRRSKSIIKKASKHVITEHPELHEFESTIKDSIKKIIDKTT